MDYDKVFENDLNKKFFYTDYPGKKIMVGKISLNNALVRLKNDEFYVLVTYKEGEMLPKEYVPLTNLSSDDTLFATFNSSYRARFDYICRDGGIQMISRLNDLESGSPNFLLGPGPATVSLEELINEQYNNYVNSLDVSSGKSL